MEGEQQQPQECELHDRMVLIEQMEPNAFTTTHSRSTLNTDAGDSRTNMLTRLETDDVNSKLNCMILKSTLDTVARKNTETRKCYGSNARCGGFLIDRPFQSYLKVAR